MEVSEWTGRGSVVPKPLLRLQGMKSIGLENRHSQHAAMLLLFLHMALGGEWVCCCAGPVLST